MATFTIRVELVNAPADAYERLRAELENKGFTRKIRSNDGTEYILPQAEFNFSGSIPKSEVLELAKQAVATAGSPARLLVTESAGRTWHNLTR